MCQNNTAHASNNNVYVLVWRIPGIRANQASTVESQQQRMLQQMAE